MIKLLQGKRFPGMVILLTASLIILAACTAQGQGTGEYASLPVGKAYAEGKEIFFAHTEASDPDIATMLSDMMKSPVILVPSLANVPEETLANVYVFENGVKGKGPLGFQMDVFDNPPGSPDYSPLRQIILVKWLDEGKASELKSVSEILEAESAGELSTTMPGVVVNMPFMVWDGDQR